MNTRFVILFLLCSVSIQNAYTMKPTKKSTNGFWCPSYQSTLAEKIDCCAKNAQVDLENALSELKGIQNSSEKIALVLDIDGTCFEENSGVNEPIRLLAEWARKENIRIFYLSARPEEWDCGGSEPYNFLPGYCQELKKANYPTINKPTEEVICQKLKFFSKNPAEIGEWKQAQLTYIREKYNLLYMVFLDDQETNIDSTKQWQYLVPTEYTKNTPQQTRRIFIDYDEVCENTKVEADDLFAIFDPSDIEV